MNAVQEAPKIDQMLAAVNQRVANFAAIANVPFNDAATYFTLCQQLHFLRWLEGKLVDEIENYTTTKGGAWADLVVRRRITTRRREQLENVLAEMEKVASRPLPDFAQARMMEWAQAQGEDVNA